MLNKEIYLENWKKPEVFFKYICPNSKIVFFYNATQAYL